MPQASSTWRKSGSYAANHGGALVSAELALVGQANQVYLEYTFVGGGGTLTPVVVHPGETTEYSGAAIVAAGAGSGFAFVPVPPGAYLGFKVTGMAGGVTVSLRWRTVLTTMGG